MYEKRMTVRDIAQKAGVSITTVSRFLNQDYSAMSDTTRQRIQEIVDESGYMNVKGKNRSTVAVVLPDLTDPFFATTVEALGNCMEKEGFALQLCMTHDSLKEEERVLRMLLASDVAGIVYFSSVTFKEKCYGLLAEAKKPFVVMDSYMSEPRIPALVFSNGVFGMYQVTKYLLETGHRNIAYLSGLRFNMFEYYRYQGYVNALLDSSCVVNPGLIRFTGFSMEDGMAAFQELLASGEQFSAIICESDQLAAGVYKVCSREGIRIPEDLSVVGYNNSVIASILEPALTSVDQQLDQLAVQVMQMLKQQIAGEDLTKRVCMVEPKLVHRDSIRKLCSEDVGKDNI